MFVCCLYELRYGTLFSLLVFGVVPVTYLDRNMVSQSSIDLCGNCCIDVIMNGNMKLSNLL